MVKKRKLYFLVIFVISKSSFALETTPIVDPNIISFTNPIEVLEIVKPYLPDNPIILEAGAFDGDDSLKMANFWEKGMVYSFEPIPENYKKLVTKVAGVPNINTFCLALGDFVGMHEMHIAELESDPGVPSFSSSLLPPKDHLSYATFVKFNSKVNVPVVTIDEFARNNNLSKIDFMWLDIQGYELNVLKASPNILKTVKAIITEVEFVEAYQGQYLYKDVKEWLEGEGFTLVATNTSYQWFGDALFIRK